MDRCFLSNGNWLFPERLGALARKGPPWDRGVLEAHGQDRVGKKDGEEWGQLGHTNGRGSHGIDHGCPMAPSVFLGAWAAPWLGQLGPAWQWVPRT